MSSTTIATIGNEDIRIISEKELKHISTVLALGQEGLSYRDLVIYCIEYVWSKRTLKDLQSIWKNDWASTKIEGKHTGMPSMNSLKKAELVLLIERRLKKTLQYLRDQEDDKDKKTLGKEGIASHIQGYSFTYKFSTGNISIGSFKNAEYARQARFNIEDYIKGKSDDLNILGKLAIGFDSSYLNLIIEKAQRDRGNNSLLDMNI